MNRFSLTFCLAVVLSFATPAGGHGATDAAVMTLSVAGKPRSLQGPILGGSTSAFFEHLLDNPAKIAALSKMAIGLDRFPGGSDANFYNWRTGLIEIKAYPDSSPYVRFWAKAAANIARGMPDGVTMEQYAHFSGQIGAEVILVPNLESSGVADQVEWFKHLSGKGLVPQKIELGNEFWVAMGNDSRSLARWPDAPSTMRTMKQYLEALKPYMPPNAKIAVQAAASGFNVHRNPRALFWQRIERWDDDLRPEPWFDAVTLHLYPRLSEVMGDPLAGITLPTRENAMPRLKAMMAQVDEGTEGVLQRTERHLPGKEIWITEWNSRGANAVTQRGADVEPASPAMEMLLTVRTALVHLRHPSVTASLFFMYDFRPQNPFSPFVPDGKGGYLPVPSAAALRWLNQAANDNGSFQRVVQAGARPIAGEAVVPQSYLAVEGGLFRAKDRVTLILENVSADLFSLNPITLVPGRRPTSVEFISMPDLERTDKLPARIEHQDPAESTLITPFSVTRIVWE
ncbi:MAG: hypothetical protein ABSD38_31500 [Syntrophorhabdales bacterium]|jgi:hypothetical protein